MTTLLLVRHATTDAIGRTLAGRIPGIPLNERGREQSEQLVERLSRVGLAAIYSSPIERCRQSCLPLSEHTNVPVCVREDLTELDFGEWSGMSFSELDTLHQWRSFNSYRTGARPPGGETILEAQARMVLALQELAERHPGGAVAVFGHGDPLKAAIAFFVGAPVELLGRFVLSPASISTLALESWGAELRSLNVTGTLGAE